MSLDGPGSLDGVEVIGGVGGLEVRADDLAAAASALAASGGDLLAVAGSATAVLTGGDLREAALVDPVGGARGAAARVGALLGPRGLAATAVRVEARAGRLVLAAARYRAADDVVASLTDARRWLQGSTGVLAVPLGAVFGLAWAGATLATGADPVAGAEAFLLAHPGVVDEVVGSAPGAVSILARGLLGPLAEPADVVLRARTGRGLLPTSLGESAGLLALLYPPGQPVVVPTRREPVTAPADLGAVLADLRAADDGATGDAAGDIVVRRQLLSAPDGSTSTSYVVSLPGTKDWQPDPRHRTGLNDLASNLELMAGDPNARVGSVAEALRAAGARPGEPVMLVGHSQGGMVALRAAEALSGSFSITHVVTAGSPVGRMPVPDGVQVLSLENRQDVVPRLDGAPNRSSAGHVTVLFDAAADGLGAEHGLATVYAPAAAALSGTDDPALREWLRTADLFLLDDDEQRVGHTATATSTTFRVRNADGG